ncbi:MAG: M20/M25/M40 family metallo-hydrolase [Dehalococcoidia bacterium]
MMTSPNTERGERLLADIRALSAIYRPSASPGEREAAEWVASRLRGAGLEATIEEFRFYPAYWNAWGIHVGLAAVLGVASLFSRRLAKPSAVLASLLAASFWGDLTTGFHWLRGLLPAQPGYNVIARLPNPGAERILVISAHHDAPHSGAVFHPGIASWLRPRKGRVREQPPILQLPFAAILTVAAGSLLRAGGLPRLLWRDPLRLAVLLNSLTAALLADIGRSPVSPGANDNASGVAAVLALAEQFKRKPPANLEIWFLSTGCEEAIMGGMLAFVRRHFPELAARRPFFLNFEMLGSGRVSYMEGEGFLKLYLYDREAVNLAAEVAGERGFEEVTSHTIRFGTDALVPARHGFPAITVDSISESGFIATYHWPTDTPENIDVASVERAVAFAGRMVELLDERAAAV